MNLSFKLITDVLGRNNRSRAYKELRSAAAAEPVIKAHPGAVVEYKFHQHGFSLTYQQNLRAFHIVDLFALNYEQFSKYKCDLPKGVLLSDKKIDICRKLGEPIESGKIRRTIPVPNEPTDAEWNKYLERQGAEPFTNDWCVFNFEDCQIRFWFDDDLEGQMTSVTLTTLDRRFAK